ncbi:hypothetical protein PPERSA_03551 [Pseudocohnilembus persalinus]|uniref:Transmembrane protein n=1 Tax=Pseudocohnilembus persalinus TaxID=266149 RepID=A0A0V0QQB0_PSEPJ|nr:hypothetical protein PPERSA_03551 [Pseudocohnilembus persalinus]|eukprot:KRX04311.1 hypothetical protein PPERSA_03551 [Pseudocohnilembus persalinus]
MIFIRPLIQKVLIFKVFGSLIFFQLQAINRSSNQNLLRISNLHLYFIHHYNYCYYSRQLSFQDLHIGHRSPIIVLKLWNFIIFMSFGHFFYLIGLNYMVEQFIKRSYYLGFYFLLGYFTQLLCKRKKEQLKRLPIQAHVFSLFVLRKVVIQINFSFFKVFWRLWAQLNP